MKKRVLCLLLAAILLLALVPAASADDTISTEEELLELFARQKKDGVTDFDVTCEKALFDSLMANNAARLSVLQIKGGIADGRVRYSEAGCLIRFDRLVYTDAPWAECLTEKDAKLAVQHLLSGGATDFTLLCSPALSKSLAESGTLRNYAAQAGFGSVQFNYYTSGVVSGAEPRRFSLPFAPAEDVSQFNAAIEEFASRELDEFYIVFSPDFYQKISSDEEQRDLMHAASMLDRYSYTSEAVLGLLHYTRVSYTEAPCLVCRSEQDVIDSIARMGALGITDFRLYLADNDLRGQLLDTPLAYLHGLEAKGGMAWASISHNNNTIYYTEAHIDSEAVALTTPEEARLYMEEKGAAGAEEINLFCTPELYDQLMGKLGAAVTSRDGMDPIYDLIAQAGIFDYELSSNRATGAIMIAVNAYYPGAAILQALEAGTESALPVQQQATLAAARKLAEECRSADPLETARRLHDALCEAIVYTEDETTEEDDSAIGALLSGKANCDGYADAFYLTGTLAGLEIRYQHGDSRVKGAGQVTFGDTVTHMWNLMKIGDTWRMVDVTWDDDEDFGPAYTWFNLGRDRASLSHIWNEETTVELLGKTDLAARPENEYTVSDQADLEAAAEKALGSGQRDFSLFFEDESFADYKAALELISSKVTGSYRYSWTQEMRLLRVSLG